MSFPQRRIDAAQPETSLLCGARPLTLSTKMNARTITSIAPLAAMLVLASPHYAASVPDKLNQPLKWDKLNPDGSRQDLPDANADKPKARAVRKKEDGTIVSREASPAIQRRGSSIYVADLPEAVRRELLFVDFSISGTAGSTADQGSIIDIDGAIIGFQLEPEVNRAEVMVLVLGGDDQPVWRKAGWGLPIDPNKQVTASPRMAVRLDYKNSRWALFANDVLVAGDLPLFSDKGAPTIRLKAGLLETDLLILKRIRIADKPSGRDKKFIPAGPDGRIDYAKARAENDPRLGVPAQFISGRNSTNPKQREPKQ